MISGDTDAGSRHALFYETLKTDKGLEWKNRPKSVESNNNMAEMLGTRGKEEMRALCLFLKGREKPLQGLKQQVTNEILGQAQPATLWGLTWLGGKQN